MSDSRGPGAPEGNQNAVGNSGGGAPEGNENGVGNNGGAPIGNTNAAGNPGGGAPEENANARTHGLHINETRHYEKFASQGERAAIEEIYLDYLDRYRHRHGREPPRARWLIFVVATNMVREVTTPDSTDADAPPLSARVEREDGERELRLAPEWRAKRRLKGFAPDTLRELELLPPGEWSNEKCERSRMRDVKPGGWATKADPLPTPADLEAKRRKEWIEFLDRVPDDG